jgi:hypothetical protein
MGQSISILLNMPSRAAEGEFVPGGGIGPAPALASSSQRLAKR